MTRIQDAQTRYHGQNTAYESNKLAICQGLSISDPGTARQRTHLSVCYGAARHGTDIKGSVVVHTDASIGRTNELNERASDQRVGKRISISLC